MRGINVTDLRLAKSLAEERMAKSMRSVVDEFMKDTGVVPNGVVVGFKITTKSDIHQIGRVFHSVDDLSCELHLELDLDSGEAT